ncbi:MAG: hypothetical protein IJD13_07765 [Oscillospiraceae bacterium]|nr:hypothetical protein [Oscillospiraceae bacterium]
MDISSALEKMPRQIRDKVKEIVAKYLRTGDRCYAEIAIGILEEFENDSSLGESAKELILTLKNN